MFKFKKAEGWGFLRALRNEEFRWLSDSQMKSLSNFLIKAVMEEANKDRAFLGQLPDTPRLNYSWSVKIEGDTMLLVSDWPWMEAYVEGKDPYPMPWLTREKGVYKVPIIQRDGTVLIRTAPLTTQDAWIHPGIARHTFLNRAFQRTINRMNEMFLDYLATFED